MAADTARGIKHGGKEKSLSILLTTDESIFFSSLTIHLSEMLTLYNSCKTGRRKQGISETDSGKCSLSEVDRSETDPLLNDILKAVILNPIKKER